MKWNRVAVGLAALAVLAPLSACGSDASGSSAGSEFDQAGSGEVSGEGEELSLWIMEGTNPNAEPYVEDLKAAFEDKTGATLDVQFVPWAEAHDKFVNAIAGDTTPDVAEIGTTWTPEFAAAGALMDLSGPVEKAGLEEQLVPGLVQAGTVDDGLYGMPWYAGVRSFVYRTDVFDQAGVTPPTSWDELVAAGEKLKKANPDMVTLPVPGDSEYGVYPFIWGAGGRIAEQDGDSWTSTIDSPEAQEGIEFYTDLALEHGFSTPAATTWDEADLSDAFARGDVAMMISGSWTPRALVEANPDLKGKIGAFPIPGQDGGISPSFLGGSHLGVFQGTENPDLAFALVETMATGDLAAEWGEQSGFFPGTKKLLEQVQAEEDPVVAPFAQQMVEGGASLPVTPLYGQVQGKKTVAAMLQSILSGDASVQEATEQAAKEMDAIFAAGS
ncbi:sugar ABC transporter substrate-binding protein [Nocardioides mesophilus]|uniref:Sugar ABC transporter substrate-binding protein n=1 Tax=Nocardioides mesophilus TaxID=433659 RepID=A0A7G9RBP9_9ACTN|nr:sugar ABC transporter substrate-binding protein [Nocardioides mesophilus]QNN53024.1 sugar ABC transporter substrate-binding protein [Nocardioides mesophilus]